MKKDRNTFFQESQVFNQTGMPNYNMPVANQPFAMTSYANQGFYAGPNMQAPLNYNTPIPQTTTGVNYDYQDIESRLSKIERQINRLDLRLTKLENGTFYPDEIDTTNNVYMV